MKGFTRPKAEVLSGDSIVPDENIISPPPNQFTHKLKRDAPYYFDEPQQGKSANGTFVKGTSVVLLRHDGGSYCRVSDGRGLYVAITYDSLKAL
ncbi:MAG TPA: hypothetical protein VIX17_26490 [Pyrinomonadaceae bacterium]|jgi:hypothetical protein